LDYFKIERVALMIRDPRDALVSWWRHLERDDVRNNPALVAHCYACGLMSKNYYSMEPYDRLGDLVNFMFPAMQTWLADWAKFARQNANIRIHIIRYEDFVQDSVLALRGLYRFFGYDTEPVMPQKEGPVEQMSAGIHLSTHFRRGVTGSHRDEIPDYLQERLNQSMDVDVFKHFGWAH
jgi:hypothetical protein